MKAAGRTAMNRLWRVAESPFQFVELGAPRKHQGWWQRQHLDAVDVPKLFANSATHQHVTCQLNCKHQQLCLSKGWLLPNFPDNLLHYIRHTALLLKPHRTQTARPISLRYGVTMGSPSSVAMYCHRAAQTFFQNKSRSAPCSAKACPVPDSWPWQSHTSLGPQRSWWVAGCWNEQVRMLSSHEQEGEVLLISQVGLRKWTMNVLKFSQLLYSWLPL